MQSSIEFWKEPLGAQRLVVPYNSRLARPEFRGQKWAQLPRYNPRQYHAMGNIYEYV
jgi:hypothetical protein